MQSGRRAFSKLRGGAGAVGLKAVSLAFLRCCRDCPMRPFCPRSLAAVAFALAASHASSAIVINEVHYAPSPKTAPLEYIEQTITELEALNPDVVVPMHCSGANFIRAMQRRMPEKLVTSNVGARFTFGG